MGIDGYTVCCATVPVSRFSALRLCFSRLQTEVDMRSRVATKSAVIALALAGTAIAFIAGAQAGALLNGRVMAVSVARVPMPVIASPKSSPVNGHIR
jgi:hypothetical protein